ncbi:MAG: prephenate dehydratase [Calditrichaceae bacterium]
MSERPIFKIAYQGEKGAYSDNAIDSLFGDRAVEKFPFRTSYDVIDAIKNNTVDFGLLPIDNSIIGNITHTYDLLLEHKLYIVNETIIPIHHAFLAVDQIPEDEIKKIYSHPAAISQCEVFLRSFDKAEIIPTYDTAGSAKMIAENRLYDTAAIASEKSADLYSLTILRRNIEDFKHNQTRFVLVSVNPGNEDREKETLYKTSIVFSTPDKPGMLVRCLGIFEKYNINMSLLTSRPHKSKLWNYHFFVDIDGHVMDENVSIAFDEIRRITGSIHIMGSYTRFIGK